jgi:hypothetical protein
MQRRHFIKTTVLLSPALASGAPMRSNSQALDRADLNEVGPQGERLAGRIGLWDLTEIIWKSPGAEPQTSAGLIAERFMMGSVLQEIIRPADDIQRNAVKRSDLLTFDRGEARWQYVSFATRDPVGLMPAWSKNACNGKSIDLDFYLIAAWNDGGRGGILMRMRQVTTFDRPDSDTKDQYLTLADGTGGGWDIVTALSVTAIPTGRQIGAICRRWSNRST